MPIPCSTGERPINLKQSRFFDIAAKPEKILYVWDYLEWGGAQIHWFALMREAKKHCPVLAIMPKGSDTQLTGILSEMDIPYEFLSRPRNIKTASGLVQKLKRHRDKLLGEYAALRHLKRHDLKRSVVHIEFAPWNSFLALSYLCRKSGQVFVTMHNRIATDSPLRRAFWRFKFARIARFKNFHILASNLDARESLRDLAPARFVDEIKITYTSVNPPEIEAALEREFDRAALCEKFGLDAGKFTVLCVGQFIDRKGRWVFLDAAKEVLAAAPDVQFAWVSNYHPDEEELKRIENYGLGNGFKLITNDRIGNDRRDLLRMYRLGDVFVLPSFVEGLPIALLEAMAMKVPVISTNINGIPEAIVDGETGLLVEPYDAEGLAQAVLELKNNESLRQELAANGQKIVAEKFDEREAARIAWESYSEAGK